MKTYSRNEAIELMAQTAGVVRENYLFKCFASLDGYNCSFRSNNKDWLYGIFDGRKYNLGLLDPTFLADMKVEYGEDAGDAIAAIANDTANPDNYEPYSSRMRRIAERLLDECESGDNATPTPENIIFSAKGNHVFILTDEEVCLMNNDTRINAALWNDDVNAAKELLKEEEG